MKKLPLILLFSMVSVFFSSHLFSGSLSGRVNFEGKGPKKKALRMNADPVCGAAHKTPPYRQSFIINEEGYLKNVMIYLKDVKFDGDMPKNQVVLDQKGCLYSPHVQGMMAGQGLLIKNSDATMHNIHGFPKLNSEFNFAMPKVVKEKVIKIDNPEHAIYIQCDIHPWMKAYLSVFDHPYFAVTDNTGHYQIDNIPPGTYEVIAWQEKFKDKETKEWKTISANVTIGEGTTNLNFTFVKNSKGKFNNKIDRTVERYADHKKLANLATEPKYQQSKYPAFISIEELLFIESSGNQSLDGLETGEINFKLVNKGKGDALGIEINMSPLSSAKNLEYEAKTTIDKIPSKSSKTVEIPITADINAKSMVRKFRIEVTEHFGFDADPATISFTTTAFEPPDLQINQTAIDDDDEGDSMGNDNSTIEPGESIEVTAFVQNFGDGDVEDVKAEVLFNTTNRNITYPDEGQVYNLGDIASGDYKEFKFYFFTSRRYDEVDLPISVKLTESKGEFGKTIDLGLKAGERTQNIVDVQITRVEKAKRDNKIRQIEGIITLADVDENIPKTKTNGKNTLVVIIGVEDYKYAPDVDYAGRDAQYFYEYSKSVLGVPEPNIYYRVDDGATSGEFSKIFAEDGWIARRLGSKTDIVFYYSGHGAPDPKSEKGYLIPHDIDPNYPSTGFSIDQIYQSLADLKANSVTVFIDACFSGESRSEEMLVEGIRPISIEITNPVLLAENFSVFSASEGKQYSAAYPEKFHGLFTYFLLKGLQGSAKGGDKNLTIGELYDYVRENVSSQAGYLDKEQDPTFIGTNKDKVLVRY